MITSALKRNLVFWLVHVSVLGLAAATRAQSDGEVRQAALKSIELVASYPALVFESRYENKASVFEKTTHVRGDKIWEEFTTWSKKEPEEEQRQDQAARLRIANL